MQVSISDIPRRMTVRQNRTEGILNYDIDNAYPQRIRSIVSNSGIASSCINTYAKHIRGNGFKDLTFYKAVVNRKGQTLDKILRGVSQDLALHRGCALHFNYNALLQISEINYVPFENCRISEPDDWDYIGKIALYRDWGRLDARSIKKNDIHWINVFNPDPEVIAAQVEAAGGFELYRGQVLWYSADGDTYPLASCDPVIEDVLTDIEIKEFKYRNTTSNFLATHIIELPFQHENQTERDKFNEKVASFQGGKQAGKIMTIENPNKATSPDSNISITPVVLQDVDKIFEWTKGDTRDSIIENYMIPKELLGIQMPGRLGTADEISDAMIRYNETTKDERNVIVELFQQFIPHFTRNLNPSGNYDIEPLTMIVPKSENG